MKVLLLLALLLLPYNLDGLAFETDVASKNCFQTEIMRIMLVNLSIAHRRKGASMA